MRRSSDKTKESTEGTVFHNFREVFEELRKHGRYHEAWFASGEQRQHSSLLKLNRFIDSAIDIANHGRHHELYLEKRIQMKWLMLIFEPGLPTPLQFPFFAEKIRS